MNRDNNRQFQVLDRDLSILILASNPLFFLTDVSFQIQFLGILLSQRGKTLAKLGFLELDSQCEGLKRVILKLLVPFSLRRFGARVTAAAAAAECLKLHKRLPKR